MSSDLRVVSVRQYWTRMVTWNLFQLFVTPFPVSVENNNPFSLKSYKNSESSHYNRSISGKSPQLLQGY